MKTSKGWTYFEGNIIDDMASNDLDGIIFWLAEASAKWCLLMHFVLDFLPLREIRRRIYKFRILDKMARKPKLLRDGSM